MEPVAEQREQVVWIAERYLDGDGAPAIARGLNERGVPGPAGGAWSVASVRNTLFHPAHSGQIAVPGEDQLVRGQHWDDRFYDPEKYARIMQEKARRSRRRGPAPHSKYVLSGVVSCGLCGRNLVGAKTDKSARRYLCPRGGTDGFPDCIGVSCRAEPMEEVVVEALLAFAGTPMMRESTDGAAVELAMARDRDLEAEIALARHTLAEIDHKRKRWAEAYTSEAIDLERFGDYENRLVAQHDRAQEHLAALIDQLNDQESAAEHLRQVREALTDLPACWQALTHEQQRQLLHLATARLAAEPEGDDVRVRLRLHLDGHRDWLIPAASHQRVKATSGVDALTLTELAVLALLDDGLAPIEISRRRGVGRACTHTHMHNIRRKLNVANDQEAIAIARERIAQTRRFLPTDPVDDPSELTSRPALTDDQRDVLRLISQGLTYAEIGEQLGKTESNIKYFSRALFRKFSVDNRRELVLKTRHKGMVPPPEDNTHDAEEDEDDDD